MNIAIAGSTGLIGEVLVEQLRADGHTVTRLVRDSRAYAEPAIVWNPAAGELGTDALDGMDAVICLSGESIAARWTRAKKKRLWDSRVGSVTLLARCIACTTSKPSVFVCASGVGYYGERGEDVMRDGAQKGTGFLSDLCEAWESAAQPAADAGVRVVNLRFGVVLDPRGGLLKNVVPVFKAGLGGVIGSGSQYMSWVSMDDLLGIFRVALEDASLRGPVNAVSPQPATNREFTRALAAALHRPAIFPVPAPLIRLALGEAGENLALGSTRVVPSRLLELGHNFKHPAIGPALEEILRCD